MTPETLRLAGSSSRHSALRLAAAGLGALLAQPGAAWGNTDEVDPKVALAIMLRVLTYDKGFKARGDGDFVLLVPAEAAQADARDRLVSAAKGLNLTSIQGRALRFLPVELKDAAGLKAAVAQYKANAVLVVQGLSPAALGTIARVANAEQLYTLALDPGTVDQKFALMSVTSHEGRPQIVLNIAAARGLNASFDNSVLRLAKLIQ